MNAIASNRHAGGRPALGIESRLASVAVAVALLAAVTGCSATDASKSVPTPVGEVSQAAIWDQVHGGAETGVFWLPPLVAAPALQGSFDGDLRPTVTVTPLVPGATPIATFTTTSGPGSETVRVDTANQNYVVNWHTDQFVLLPAVDYRIAVLLSGRTVAFLDVDVVAKAGQAKNVDTSQYVALVDGKTLPIKWFMNTCSAVSCSAADVCHLVGTCDANTGACSNPNAPDGTVCSSANACGRTDTCRSGACIADTCAPCNDARDCSPGQGCVDRVCSNCNVDADCAGSSAGSRCTGNGGACVACLANTDCLSPAAPQCTANVCVACTGDVGCIGHTKARCELVDEGSPHLVGTCVECRSNTTPLSADCTSDTAPFCDSTVGTCGSCSGATGEAACQENHGGRHCEDNNSPAALNGTCVQCRGERAYVTTDCSSRAPLCNPASDTCGLCDVDGATECVKFGAAFICDNPAVGGTGACVGCVTDDDCADPALPHCVSKSCVGCDSTSSTHGDESCARFAAVGLSACQPDDGVALFPGSCKACSVTNALQCSGSSPACETTTGNCQP